MTNPLNKEATNASIKFLRQSFKLEVRQLLTFCFALFLLTIVSCRKYIDIAPPKTELIKATVFGNDETAKGAIAGLYYQLVNSGYASGSISGISYLAGQSADELVPGSGGPSEFYNNAIQPSNATLLSALWNTPYNHIFIANSILEGLEASSSVTSPLKDQLSGEAKFVRALVHFYLVNLFGDVPLVLTTDYRQNATITRTSKIEVYNQIIDDLKDAENLLSADYSFSKGEKLRVNKWAAKALLARVYLYQNDFANAETEATAVINSSLYSLSTLDKVFLKNSSEAIWQLAKDNTNTADASIYPVSATAVPSNATLRPDLVLTFESEDLRKTQWTTSTTVLGNKYYYPTKYKAYTSTPVAEYSMVLRLAEQYLIRAEARLKQGKIIGANSAASDINIIRTRANLGPTTAATASEMMAAIEKERRLELFTEWGHRWFDLKRWPSMISPSDNSISRADDILPGLKVGWNKNFKLFPIPQFQLLNDPAMANDQNPGY